MGKDPVKRIISFWKQGGADYDYYKAAEDPGWIEIFWAPASAFRALFDQLDISRTLEIACGTGRHSFQVRDRFDQLTLLDSSAAAINLAREKFRGFPNVTYIHHPSGTGLPESLPDNSFSTVFSYDAMVHFEQHTILSYMKGAARVLVPGGLCLLHYSNFQANPGGLFSDNPGWRNHMTQEIFNAMAADAGLEILDTRIFNFSSTDSDALSLLRKPVDS